ncbi:hypothetical protein DDB_G0291318 [Dictyostelium discoideum AX4]|uniref:CHCH domain-containing protein n=1 Tax=Dictyostelium discoideum TaxID=44689 RepID=Q1ZXB5_DICDI|nr:hypothetical protein DDB_G0291318 [Dictyostelium discoideum AX4]EAS66819.1 hypothetical protein DDB_G0291318 [Dictyostelium discoideum AX4]|eukprot:XP_001134502.1 hypothetical protein DDB_G0291318 [Dictyostelium discoideum AX4]
MGQDRDDNPYKLSPRYRNKAPVIRNPKFDCIELFSKLGSCLSKSGFDISKCAPQLALVNDCKKQAKIVRRVSPFGFHFNRIVSNKFKIPIP